jgi:predicted Zn-dependent protease with MMP-like domain
LRDAADLFVTRLGSDRALLELGQAYALRGLRLAERDRRRRPEPVVALALLAAQAENDLGESKAALDHAARVLRLAPRDVDGWYARGVALYELCRFDQARAAFEQVRALAPDDAWALDYLGLLAERRGDSDGADALQRRARALAPKDFSPPVEISAADFALELERAVAALSDQDRQALAGVAVEAADLPALADLTAGDPPLSPSILGLFRGPPEQEPCTAEDGPRCRTILLYRKNLARFARDRAELVEQVRVTLLHELGHLRGENDDDLRGRGLE